VNLTPSSPVWYLAYGSNLSRERLSCYLAGGTPSGSARAYVGCRDPAPPRRAVAVWLPGALSFGGRSRVWGGAMAFYDPTPPHDATPSHRVAARAYLVTYAQFSDLVAQECRRPLGTPLVLDGADGRHRGHPGVYDLVLQVGPARDVPRLTLTSARPPRPAAPSAAYARTILRGLADGFGLTPARRVDYLLRARGVDVGWRAEELSGLLEPAGPTRG
jgi:hypothetical protein